MSLGYSYPGLAAATGTRVDSAAKHTLACRVSEPLMMTWCEDETNPRNHMHNQKMKYCVHKDDLVLNVSQALNPGGTIVTMAKAYPSVVSNLGDMSMPSKDVISCLYHEAKTGADFLMLKSRIRQAVARNSRADLAGLVDRLDETEWKRVSRELKDLPYFTAQGYALGIAYASNLTGDTVGTILIGGMQTVMNGAFEMRAGQQVQWYFDFEADLYHRSTVEGRGGRTLWEGSRKSESIASDSGTWVSENRVQQVRKTGNYKEPVQQEDRRRFHERGLGDTASFPKNYKKHNIAYPKPYVINNDGTDHYGDKIRIFAKCITGGRPFEMCDIMLMTQSL